MKRNWWQKLRKACIMRGSQISFGGTILTIPSIKNMTCCLNSTHWVLSPWNWKIDFVSNLVCFALWTLVKYDWGMTLCTFCPKHFKPQTFLVVPERTCVLAQCDTNAVKLVNRTPQRTHTYRKFPCLKTGYNWLSRCHRATNLLGFRWKAIWRLWKELQSLNNAKPLICVSKSSEMDEAFTST